jgi:hypothetical protein
MPKKKSDDERVFIKEPDGTDTVQIHVTGDMMPRFVFFQILELMKKYVDNKTIVFVVYNANMMLLVRESVPSEFYDRIELYSPKVFESQEGLRNAG